MGLLRYFIILLVLLIANPVYAAYDYWIRPAGTAVYTACRTAKAVSYPTPPADDNANYCDALSDVNSKVVAGDRVNLKTGTYTIIGNAIVPTNSGSSAEAMIEYTAYTADGSTYDAVTITGAADLTGYNSRAINLDGDSYVKITHLIFTNMHTYLWMNNASTYNEVSYCTFQNNRNSWNDVIASGTAKNDADHNYQSSTVLYDSGGFGTLPVSFRIYNATDKSSAYIQNSVTATTIDHHSYPLAGGTDNHWDTGDEYQITYQYSYTPSYIRTNSNNNWIHHNTFTGMGAYSATHDEGVGLQVGIEESATDIVTNNTIENNHIYASGHHALGVNNCKYCVIRNNYLHNEGWYSADPQGVCATRSGGGCGYRVVSCAGHASNSGFSLYEKNTIGYGAVGGYALHSSFPAGNIGASGSGVSLSTPSNIYRYNDHIGNALYGLRFGSSVGNAGWNNRVYNNTFYKNGYSTDDDPGTADYYREGIYFYGDTCAKVSGIVIKNNLLYDQWSETNKDDTAKYWPAIYAINSTVRDSCAPANIITNNFTNSTSNYLSSDSQLTQTDPKFTTPTLPADSAAIIAAWSDYTVTSPDLTLTADSIVAGVVNGGTHLTTATEAGTNSTLLPVVDASYFQDGTWGSSLAVYNESTNPTGLRPDQICIGTVSNCAAISKIYYTATATEDGCNNTANCILLDSALTWADNAPILLYKKSDGTQVLYGSAPDYGAHEYTDSPDDPPQYTVTVSLTGTGCSLNRDGAYEIYAGDILNISATINNGWQLAWSGSCPQDSGTTTRVCTPDADDETVDATCTEIKVIW